MASKSIRRTIEEHPEACPGGTEALADTAERSRVAQRAKRAATVREITARANPLRVLAKLMLTSSDPHVQLQAAKALAPYCFPAMRAIEVSGPDGERLTVEVRRLDSSGTSSGGDVPEGEPGSEP